MEEVIEFLSGWSLCCGGWTLCRVAVVLLRAVQTALRSAGASAATFLQLTFPIMLTEPASVFAG